MKTRNKINYMAVVCSLWLKNKGEKMLYMATAYGEGDGAYEETERGVILVPQTTVAMAI